MKSLSYVGCLLVGLIQACSDDTQSSNELKIQTLTVEKIGPRSALGGGSIDMIPNPEIIEKGVLWSKTPGVTADSPSRKSGPTGTGTFRWVLAKLEPGTKYYVRAYAWDGVNIAYGDELSFTTSVEPMFTPGGGVEDVHGNKYKTVILGKQEWMAENLRATKFNNGDNISNVQGYQQWQALTTPAWTHFEYDFLNQYDTGKLYNWYTVSDPRKVCPSGWHVPTITEWNELIEQVGGKWLAPIRLKVDTATWLQPNLATNESGFSAIHSGACAPCNDLYGMAMWWSSTPKNSEYATYVGAAYGEMPIWIADGGMGGGLGVRCVKD